MDLITASSSCTFWSEGQFSFLICWLTKLAWTLATRFWIMDNYIDWSTLSCDTTHLPRYFSLWERSCPLYLTYNACFPTSKNGVFCYNIRKREMLACKGISLTGDELRSNSSKTCWGTVELLSWYHLIKNLSKIHWAWIERKLTTFWKEGCLWNI